FIVAVLCAGWIAVVGQPHPNWFRDHFTSWSEDIGILGFVKHMTTYVDVMAFGLGALLASAPGAFGASAPAPAGRALAERPAPSGRPATTNGDGAAPVAQDRERTGV